MVAGQRALGALVAGVWLCSAAQAAPQTDITAGQVIVAGQNDYRVYGNDGVFIEAVSIGANVVPTGCFADSDSNLLYGMDSTSSTVVVVDGSHPHSILQTIDTSLVGGADPRSIAFDAAGNLYVGHAGGDLDIKKFAPDGTFIGSFDAVTEFTGTSQIAISADQRTVFFTSGARRVLAYDVVADVQLPDFALLPGAGEARGLLLLPPFDGTGGMLVVDMFEIRRLDANGTLIQTYDATGQNDWFAIALDTDCQSFWVTNPSSGEIYRFAIDSGVIELGPIVAGLPFPSLFGICAVPVAEDAPQFDPPTPCGQTFLLTAGTPFSFDVAASDPDATAVTLSAQNVPPGAAHSPPLPQTGTAVSSQFSWTPGVADAGRHEITYCVTDGNRTTTCQITLVVSTTFLVIGRGVGEEIVPVGGHAFRTQLADVAQVIPMSLLAVTRLPVGTPRDDGPFALPMDVPFTAQIVMWNPEDHPEHPELSSCGFYIQLFEDDHPRIIRVGQSDGIRAGVREVRSRGSVELAFPFRVDGR